MIKSLVIQMISLTLDLVILALWTLGLSRTIYEAWLQGCTVGFPSFLLYIVLPGACSCYIPIVAE